MSKKLLPISEYQQRFFLEWALAPTDNKYNISFVYKIKGKLDRSKLMQAFDIFIKKHEVCHAKYNEDGGKCYYENYSIQDFFYEGELDPNEDVTTQLKALIDRPFNLTQDILMRFFLIKNSVTQDEFYLIAPFAHHILIDGNFATILLREVSDSYNLLVNGKNILTNVNKTFTDAVKAETQILTLEYKQKAKEYWLNFITDFPLNIQLPYKSSVNSQYSNNKFTDKTGKYIYFDINKQETKQLKEYARNNKSTLFIVLSAIYGFIVSKYSNQSRLLLSYPVNMRPLDYIDVAGCFVNNILLKLDLDQYEMLDELILNLTVQHKDVKNFQGYSLTHIIEDQKKYNKIEIEDFFNVGFGQTNLNTMTLALNYLKIDAIDIPWSSNVIYELDLQYDDSSGKI